MPFYLNATTPPPAPHPFEYSRQPTLQLTVEPATQFGYHSIKHHGPFDTIEAAEAEVSRIYPNGWRHLYLEDHKYANVDEAIRCYTAVPAAKATARDLSK